MNRLGLMVRRRIFIIIFAVLAIFAGMVIFWYISSSGEKAKIDSGSMEIFLTKKDIQAGTVITEDLITAKKIPEDIFTSRFITDKKDIIDKKAVKEILQGEIISKDKIEKDRPQSQGYLKFSSYIPSGLRAVSIPITYYGEQALINTGDFVDVISIHYDDSKEEVVSETVLSFKEIILINGRNAAADALSDTGAEINLKVQEGNKSMLGEIFSSNLEENQTTNMITVTFYLRPEEVEKIILALAIGTLSISICPSGEQESL